MIPCLCHWFCYFRTYILTVVIKMALCVINIRKITTCSRNGILGIQLCWIVFSKIFPEHFTSYFSETQRISEDYFGALVLFPIV
jgi:hypothetical protein